MFDFAGSLTIVSKLLPFIQTAIHLVERALGPKQGENKKELVMEGSHVLFDSMDVVSTGGQKETWDRIEDPVSRVVDGLCDLIFRGAPNETDAFSH